MEIASGGYRPACQHPVLGPVLMAGLSMSLDDLAHRAEVKSADAYDESDYESGNYYRGMRDAFAYATAELQAACAELADRADRVERKFKRSTTLAGQQRYAEANGIREALRGIRKALDGAQ